MSLPVIYRKATSEDIPGILEIRNVTVRLLNEEGNFQWDDSYPLLSHFTRDIEMGFLWVAEYEGKVAGFAAITNEPAPEYAPIGVDFTEECIIPHRLAVSPAVRNKGLAQGLMLVAEDEARRRGYRYVRVDTNKANFRMNGVFAKLGYRLLGETPFSGVKKADILFNIYEKEILPVNEPAV